MVRDVNGVERNALLDFAIVLALDLMGLADMLSLDFEISLVCEVERMAGIRVMEFALELARRFDTVELGCSRSLVEVFLIALATGRLHL